MRARSRDDGVRDMVRKTYAEIAKRGTEGAACCEPSCCGNAGVAPPDHSGRIGYSRDEILDLPEGTDMGLGCGNPQAIARLRPGETVLDLGSGGGIDCLLAARQVGPSGHVIGVDMTPEMVSKARANADAAGSENVEFRLGEIEHLPVADGSVDVIISNCVVNLSPDKPGVFREAFRVLKPGGRLAIADVIATRELPEEVRSDPALYCGCVSGAATVRDLEHVLSEAGFQKVRIQIDERSRELIRDWMPGNKIADYIASASIEAVKPRV